MGKHREEAIKRSGCVNFCDRALALELQFVLYSCSILILCSVRMQPLYPLCICVCEHQ